MNSFTKIIIDFRFSQLTEENASGNIFWIFCIYKQHRLLCAEQEFTVTPPDIYCDFMDLFPVLYTSVIFHCNSKDLAPFIYHPCLFVQFKNFKIRFLCLSSVPIYFFLFNFTEPSHFQKLRSAFLNSTASLVFVLCIHNRLRLFYLYSTLFYSLASSDILNAF